MRRSLLAFFSVLWGVGLWFFPGRLNTPAALEPFREVSSSGDLYKSSLTRASVGLLGVKYYESAEGKKHWNIRSRFAELHRNENYALLHDVDADFFAERTGNLITTQSRYGRSYLTRQEVELEGGVSIRSKKGYAFFMDRLDYFGARHQFQTEDSVKMIGPDTDRPTTFLDGEGLIAFIDNEQFVLKRNVTSKRKLSNSNWLNIRSQSAEFFTDVQEAKYRGRVRAQLPPNLTIESDVFELSMVDGEEEMVARGHVVLQHKARKGRAERAYIQIGSNQIILEEKARLYTENGEIRGKRITFYSADEDTVTVEGAEGKVAQ